MNISKLYKSTPGTRGGRIYNVFRWGYLGQRILRSDTLLTDALTSITSLIGTADSYYQLRVTISPLTIRGGAMGKGAILARPHSEQLCDEGQWA